MWGGICFTGGLPPPPSVECTDRLYVHAVSETRGQVMYQAVCGSELEIINENDMIITVNIY